MTKTAVHAFRQWVAESPSTRNPKLFMAVWKRYGFLKACGVDIYDEVFYQEHRQAEPAYAELAGIIASTIKPRSVCDFGCGNGFLIHYLKAAGAQVRGVEGSAKARAHTHDDVQDAIVNASVVEPLDLGTFDLTMSTEVAEHIPKRLSPNIVENLTRHAGKAIFFTAAAPGQWGDGHINCQPKAFWEDLFAERGWRADADLQEAILTAIGQSALVREKLSWIPQNLIILTPEKGSQG